MILAFENIPKTVTKREFRQALKSQVGIRGVLKHNRRFYVRVPKEDHARELVNRYDGNHLFGEPIHVKPCRSAPHISFCRTSLGMIRMF